MVSGLQAKIDILLKIFHTVVNDLWCGRLIQKHDDKHGIECK